MAWYHPLLFALDAEAAHRLTVRALALAPPLGRPVAHPRLAVTVAGLSFANPVGLAAGVDKDAEAIPGWFGLGFGSVEVGTLTPLPQPGNPRPRLFRLVEDRAVINRMGFNNGGIERALPRLERCTPAQGAHRSITSMGPQAGVQTGLARAPRIVGVNVGANKDTADRIADYRHGVAAASPVASYVTINISSPNTPGLRDLQHGAALADLLAASREAAGGTPLFLKVAPDLDPRQVDELARAALDHRIDALIVSNTTVSRPALRSANAAEAGGLSGAPLAPLARQRLRDFRVATGGALPLVSVGGIASAVEAYARIRAGASLVQLYGALVYEGPGLARRIARGLIPLLERDGFTSVAQAIGSEP